MPALSPPSLELSPEQANALVSALLPWQREHGRHDLPWQGSADPYRVWLSEIMLQQTPVSPVKAYYATFLAHFPTVADLATADEALVMRLWAGLGYYSRARNLHRCAQQVLSEWGGQFPHEAKDLQSLPGIGPSTAAAIASFCFGQRVSILDGNVKRVLARWLALDADVSSAAVSKALLGVAQALAEAVPTPEDMPTYTQGLMDLGATVCQPRRAACERCPLVSGCAAYASGEPMRWPWPKAKIKRQTLRWWLVFMRDTRGLWAWQRRPVNGIWGGLMVPWVVEDETQIGQVLPQAQLEHLPMFKHVLTHRDLMIYPVIASDVQALPHGDWHWCSAAEVSDLGMPAAVQRVWAQITAPTIGA